MNNDNNGRELFPPKLPTKKMLEQFVYEIKDQNADVIDRVVNEEDVLVLMQEYGEDAKWIDVIDALPRNKGTYRVIRRYSNGQESVADFGERVFTNDDGYPITHWKPN